MNRTEKDQSSNQSAKPKPALTFLQRPFVSLGILAGVATGIALLANAQQPVLKIANLGENQFFLEVTNNATPTNYTLFWTPALADQNYPWVVIGIGAVGQSNFVVDGGEWEAGFFRAILGNDLDADGIPEWQDAQPLNPAVGLLNITIDSPTSGFNFN